MLYARLVVAKLQPRVLVPVKTELNIVVSYSSLISELATLINKSKENNTILLTTEKDYFRINKNYKQNINYLKIKVEIENQNQFVNEIKKII